jgi:hypothetical protein
MLANNSAPPPLTNCSNLPSTAKYPPRRPSGPKALKNGSPHPNALQEPGYLGLALLIIGAVILIIPGILNLIFIYRAWFLIQPGGASITPGKAIGFLFIPVFGPIWMWIVLFKLPGEWNNIVSQYANTTSAPRMSIGTVFCLMFIPFIGTLIWVAQLSKAINFMVSTRLASQQQQAAPGGLQLY